MNNTWSLLLNITFYSTLEFVNFCQLVYVCAWLPEPFVEYVYLIFSSVVSRRLPKFSLWCLFLYLYAIYSHASKGVKSYDSAPGSQEYVNSTLGSLDGLVWYWMQIRFWNNTTQF